jgi:hypothetical protein
MWRILTFVNVKNINICKYKVKEYKQFVNVENINNWKCEEYQ